MTRDETASVLTILRNAYPHFYKGMKAEDGLTTLELWSTMFIGDDINVVKVALYKLIETHKGYPPDIASLKEKIRELVIAATGEKSDEELWQIFKRAVCNGVYGAKEEFEKFPQVLKDYCGSPSTLREYANMDLGTFNSVVHGQFLKQIPILMERRKTSDSLPAPVKEAISKLYTPIDKYKAVLTEGEVNDRRNEIHRQLNGG